MGKRLTLIALLVLVIGCGRSPEARDPSPPDGPEPPAKAGPSDAATAVERSDSAPGSAAAPGDADSTVETPVKSRGLAGRLVNLPGGKSGRVLVFRAGEKQPLWTGRADGEGRFALPELEPGAYRVIVPADGLHGTADSLAFVTAESGAEVAIHRPAGCKIYMLLRDEAGAPLAGAPVELSLPDLDHVADRLTLEETSDARGRVVVRGSCVFGKVRGTVRAPGRAPFEFEQRAVGNGNDRFAIQLPSAGDGGLAPTPSER